MAEDTEGRGVLHQMQGKNSRGDFYIMAGVSELSEYYAQWHSSDELQAQQQEIQGYIKLYHTQTLAQPSSSTSSSYNSDRTSNCYDQSPETLPSTPRPTS
ncbi:hypothetical protein AYX14_07093 [Cryptococcus neoformans]|nr:hypothetical protein AYX14_07129 [Cryptococcus neoformans var. grubii]OWZ60685.1 hypothetical protein AYX14_07093 [Cryptococcus neoformans var. grubii]